jgi:hypothetical protein
MIPRIRTTKVNFVLDKIAERVLLSERACRKAKGLPITSDRSFFTDAPNRGVCASTNPKTFSRLLQTLDLSSGLWFADLGGGLASACLAANMYFASATLIEADKVVLGLAKKNSSAMVSDTLGNFSSTLKFRAGNFLEIDPKTYHVIFFHQPFLQNFKSLMGDYMEKTKPGTIVISSKMDPDLYPFGSSFTEVPLKREAPTDFKVFQRI